MYRRRLQPALTATLLTGLGVAAGGCDGARYTEVFTPEVAVTAVSVVSDAGSVELVGGDELRVERVIRAPAGALELSHEIVDGELLLIARCATILPCAVDTRLAVPQGVPVRVELGEGEIWATGIDGLELSLSDGTADVDVRSRLVAQVGSGKLRGRVAEGAAARVTVARGDIDLTVPAGPWRLDVHAERLQVRGVQPDDSALGSLQLVAPSGEVRVQGGDPVATR